MQTQALPEEYRWCVDMEIVFPGIAQGGGDPSGSCFEFEAYATIDASFGDYDVGFKSTRAPVVSFSAATGRVVMGSPDWYERPTNGQAAGSKFATELCGKYVDGVDGATVTPAQVMQAVTQISAQCMTCS